MRKNPKVWVVDGAVKCRELYVITLDSCYVHKYCDPMWFNFYGYEIKSGYGDAGKIIGDEE